MLSSELPLILENRAELKQTRCSALWARGRGSTCTDNHTSKHIVPPGVRAEEDQEEGWSRT